MCGDGNHQGFIADTSVTRRTMLLTMSAAAAAGGIAAPAFAEDAGALKVTERDVSVKTADGSADAALFVPAGKGKWPAVLMWPDILGLRPVFREMGRRLAAQGYVVLVPNPYYRAKKAPVIEGQFDFGNKDDWAKLRAFKDGLTDPMVDRDSAAFVTFLDAQPQTDRRKKAGVQGFCMSGPISFRTAAVRPDRIGAVATFHPGALVTDKPSSPHLLIPKSRAAYLILIAKNDAEKMPDEKPALEAAFAKAKRQAEVEIYPANHGWSVAGSESYDEQQAERAWAELLPFYRANLR
ncbi:dienelactone hydrolase family protein [Sphingomonas segetis]|jgi:carboxymethylenebutenolidase|uniref:dienelactone hydrolase family protein n=1 Tax=Sphingomonas segetis TaxID=1104779 RepID=UPI0012D2D16F|nr:dienelactone hydrolase family protein [Sphingomonas segetis]